MRPRAGLFACLVVIPACGGSSNIEGTKVCRRYPTAFVESGRPYACTLDVRILRCNDSSGLVVQDWWYASSSDFVLEAQSPNRVRAQSRSFSTLGMLVSSSTVSTDYAYDGSGRLVQRRRRRSDVTGARELDLTDYTSWDALGRPIAGTVSGPNGAGPITIRYDDAARRMDASNGESTTVDANGNVVREVVVYGFGSPGERDRTIQTTAEICL
jgi:YD repeat-containing protein